MTKKNLHEQIKKLIIEEVERVRYGKALSPGMRFHLKHKISFYENVYRPGTKEFFKLFQELRELNKFGKIKLNEAEKELAESDLGKFGFYEGKKIPLDFPMVEQNRELGEAEYQGRDVDLNKPKRGGSKKFYVYVKCGDKVKKVSFGSPNMSLKISDPERRKAFKARHNCEDKNDKCTAGYWSCRIGRYPNITGASKSYRWW